MLNRLVAQHIIKAPFVGQPQFSVNKKFLAFAIQSAVRIKCLYREAKQHDVVMKSGVASYRLSFQQSFLTILDKESTLNIFKLKIQAGVIDSNKIFSIEKIKSYEEIGNGIAFIDHQNTLKHIDFINTQMVQSVCSFKQETFILKNSNNSIYAFNSEQKYIFSRSSTGKYTKTGEIPKNGFPFAVYSDRYLFYLNEKNVSIYDVSSSKMKGKFKIDGTFIYADIRQNLLLIITNSDNTDYYEFYALNRQPKHDQPLITNRVVFQKGKGDYYQFMNTSRIQTSYYIESKKKDREIQQNFPACLDAENIVLIFSLPKQKQKIEVIKLQNSKILQVQFTQTPLDQIISSPNKIQKLEQVQMQKIKVQSAIQVNKAEKTVNQIQIDMIEKIIDKKLELFAIKFLDLEKRVTNLEKVIHKIYRKMEESIKALNTNEVKKSVENLFSELTPQFQQYFVQVFKQISNVMEQGATYYNFKLAKQAQLHKEVLTQVVHLSLKATQQIVDLGRKELQFSQRVEQYLKALTMLKENWINATENFQTKLKDMKEKQTTKIGGKIFVKADLNPQQKKQT